MRGPCGGAHQGRGGNASEGRTVGPCRVGPGAGEPASGTAESPDSSRCRVPLGASTHARRTCRSASVIPKKRPGQPAATPYFAATEGSATHSGPRSDATDTSSEPVLFARPRAFGRTRPRTADRVQSTASGRRAEWVADPSVAAVYVAEARSAWPLRRDDIRCTTPAEGQSNSPPLPLAGEGAGGRGRPRNAPPPVETLHRFANIHASAPGRRFRLLCRCRALVSEWRLARSFGPRRLRLGRVWCAWASG
jgi:hypothetical protein